MPRLFSPGADITAIAHLVSSHILFFINPQSAAMADGILYDAWGRPVRPAAGRHRASNFHAIPNGYPDPYTYAGGGGADLHRARSHGHGQAPNIHMYMTQDNADNPPRSPGPRGRSSYRNGELGPEAAAGRMGGGGGGHGRPPYAGRSRSRGSMSPGAWEREMRLAKLLQREEEEEAKRREEAAIADYKRRREEESRERKDIIRRARLDDEERAKKEEERRKEILRQAKLDEEAKKEKEKKEWEEFERRQKEKAAEKKAKEEKEQKEYQEKVRKDFARFGLSENQIEHMVNYDEEKDKDRRHSKHRHSGSGGSGAMVHVPGAEKRHGKRGEIGGGRPTFPKIHRRDIATETLQYYDLQWEYDRHDPDYIIVMHEMNVRETDILFEHTRRLKSKKLLHGKDHKDKGDEWVVKRSRSRGKSRERSRSGIRERFAENLVRRM